MRYVHVPEKHQVVIRTADRPDLFCLNHAPFESPLIPEVADYLQTEQSGATGNTNRLSEGVSYIEFAGASAAQAFIARFAETRERSEAEIEAAGYVIRKRLPLGVRLFLVLLAVACILTPVFLLGVFH